MLTFRRTCDQEMSRSSGLANQSKKIRADQRSRKRHWNQLVAMPDRSSNSSGSDGSKVTPCQRHSYDQLVIDEVIAVGNVSTVFRILARASGQEG